MQPLFRWTAGPMSDMGFRMLKLSIRCFRKMYDPEVVICYNNVKPHHLEQMEQMRGVRLYKQPTDSLPLPPEGVAWKLYPPRLAPDRHELFIDNDLVINRKLRKITRFLSKQSVIYTQSLFAAFGVYTSEVPSDFRLNTGLFGIPPGYDFKSALLKKIGNKTRWTSHFDEQGLVASVLSTFPGRIEVNLKEVFICDQGEYQKATHGYHFVGSNRTETNPAWDMFLSDRAKRTILLL